MAFNKNFHITTKPIGAACNMNCKYCYFLSKLKTLNSFARMSDETLEQFIKSYIDVQDSNIVFFTWHGGEPTLLGLDFFKRVIELQKKHCPPNKIIENDLQTNGLLLDDDWCEFLRTHRFLVGLSVDGDDIGNAYRVDNNGEPVLGRIIRAAELMQQHGVPFNTLTVINNINSKRPIETYEFLKNRLGSRYMQFIPAVEVKGHANTAPGFYNDNIQVEEYSVSPADWGNFLTAVFNHWYEHDQGKVFIFLFENFLSAQLGRGAQMCFFEKECGHAMAIDRDGSVYACDHFVYPEYKYGNINEMSLGDIATSQRRREFAQMKSRLPQTCTTCKWLSLCNGECPKKRFDNGVNYLCDGYKMFFENTENRMKDLCEKYK